MGKRIDDAGRTVQETYDGQYYILIDNIGIGTKKLLLSNLAPLTMNPVSSDFGSIDPITHQLTINQQNNVSAYIYIAYASDNIGTGFTTVFNPALKYIAVKSVTEPITVPVVGDFTGLWTKYVGENGYTPIKDIDYFDGDNGESATITKGLVTTGLPGTDVIISNVGNALDAIFNFTIPRGDKGESGNTPTIGVGSVATGAAGTPVIITNGGTPLARTFNFTIPKGDKGTDGSGVSILGSDTYANIVAKTGMVAGDMYINTDTSGNGIPGDGITYDGTSWINVGQIRGPQGYTPQKNIDYFDGVKGDKGDKGDQGIQGETGVTVETDPTIYSWAKAADKPVYAWTEITSKPAFSTVATSGSYADLINKPVIPTQFWTGDTYGINYTVANVGIGNYSNPSYKLKVESNISSGYAASFSHTATNGNGIRVSTVSSTDNGDIASFWGNGLDWVSITAAGTINIRGRASAPLSSGGPYGRLYALTDGKLYWKNSTGTAYDLTVTGIQTLSASNSTDPFINLSTVEGAGGGNVQFVGGTNMTITKDAMNNILTFNASVGGSMTYPSEGLAKSTGSAWATSIVDNSTNWNMASTNMGKASINGSGTYNYLDPYYFAVNSSLIGIKMSEWIDPDSSLPVKSYDIFNALNAKQPMLVSGTNIKTVNGASILGSGNLVVSGSGTSKWQQLTGAIAPATITDKVLLGSTTDRGDYKLQLDGKMFIGDGSGATILEDTTGSFLIKSDFDGSGEQTFFEHNYATNTTTLSNVLKLWPMSSAPSFPTEGCIYINSVDHHIYVYLAGVWKQMDN